MAIKIQCPSCGASLSAPDSYHGKTITCPKCNNRFTALTEQERQTDEHEREMEGPRQIPTGFKLGCFVILGAIAAILVVYAIVGTVSERRGVEEETVNSEYQRKAEERERNRQLDEERAKRQALETESQGRQQEQASRREAEARRGREEERRRYPISVSAEDLYSAYKENTIAADSLYQGKVLSVYGEVTSIGREILGRPYVCLAGGRVQCLFSQEDERLLSHLKKGTSVTIVGECTGYFINVLLTNCRIH